MCGIFGVFSRNSLQGQLEKLLQARDCLAHRGPDSHGYWLGFEHKIFLAHRRLSIIDLSAAGHQPMLSASGRFSVVFNGEIYNYRQLRAELSSQHDLAPDCGDTAVMLAAFESWGVEQALQKFTGMFAFALWDQKTQQLFLARDRAGEKPLYYGWNEDKFIFSSEPKAFLSALNQKARMNPSALGHFIRFGYIPCPLSIFEGLYKLPAASLLKLSVTELSFRPQEFSEYSNQPGLSPKRYWAINNNIVQPQAKLSEQDYTDKLDLLLRESISGQMISDVPLGAFLSGGIDSSAVVAVMQAVSSRPVRTFSIGFEEASYNEAPFAKAVAGHLGTEHTELYVSEKEALEVIPDLPSIYSEPFADSSQIPTYLVSRLTRQFVTVSLSGDGGDELFGGYERYVWTKRLWGLISNAPSFLRSPLAMLANSLPTLMLDRIVHGLNPLLPASFRIKNAGAKIQRALSIGAVKSAADLYLIFLSQKFQSQQIVSGFRPTNTALDSTQYWPEFQDIYQQLMWMDFENYMPDDIFVKVDRASMAVALECRAPFLDHHLAEFAFSLPMQMKIRNGERKYILKKLLQRYVPEKLTSRPKMGFGVPVASWLTGKLRPWAEDLLSADSLNESGQLNTDLIRQVWKLHQQGNHSNQYFIWHVLMFQAWFRQYRGSVSVP